MSRLWFFNPWNDLALGSDSTFYTPPPAAQSLAAAGETLPMWMAAPDDFVLVGRRGRQWWEEMSGRHALARPWSGESVGECVPWGWSRAARECFLTAGVDPSILPSDSRLDAMRRLSHRRLTAEAHRYLSTGLEVVEAFTEDECRLTLRRLGQVVGKYPWSSTGRGVFSGEPGYDVSFLRRCLGAIRRQGSVMIEPRYEVAEDFAMLFFSPAVGEVRFRGYSLFRNNKRAYVGNEMAPQAYLEQQLTRLIGQRELASVKSLLEQFLTERVQPDYTGWVGVDMMVFRQKDGSLRLNPCVEINLRTTMGVAAMELHRRHLPPYLHGQMIITGEECASRPYLRLNPADEAFRLLIVEEGAC